MKNYTHNYIVLDDSKKDSCCLAALGETCGVIPVCLSDTPEILNQHVPSDGPQCNGSEK